MKSKPSAAIVFLERGYRVTPQRMMILEAINNSSLHISAEEIHSQVHAKYPYIDISTVYRTLQLLKEMGLVIETDLGGGRFVYHPAGKANHHHLRCRKCGNIQDIDEHVFKRLREELRRHYGFEADFKHMGIPGICSECQG